MWRYTGFGSTLLVFQFKPVVLTGNLKWLCRRWLLWFGLAKAEVTVWFCSWNIIVEFVGNGREDWRKKVTVTGAELIYAHRCSCAVHFSNKDGDVNIALDMRLVILTLQGRIKAFSVGTKDAAELRPRELCKQFNLSAHCTDGCLAWCEGNSAMAAPDAWAGSFPPAPRSSD